MSDADIIVILAVEYLIQKASQIAIDHVDIALRPIIVFVQNVVEYQTEHRFEIAYFITSHNLRLHAEFVRCQFIKLIDSDFDKCDICRCVGVIIDLIVDNIKVDAGIEPARMEKIREIPWKRTEIAYDRANTFLITSRLIRH